MAAVGEPRGGEGEVTCIRSEIHSAFIHRSPSLSPYLSLLLLPLLISCLVDWSLFLHL